MPFLEGNKLRKQPFKLLERMSKHNISPELKSGSHTKTFSTLKGLTKTGIKLQKHGKHPKKLEIKVQHTPPDAKLLAKYEHQLIDLSSGQCNETDSVDVAIEKPGRTCQDHHRETNTKGKVRPIPTPRKIVSIPSSSSFIQIREPEENPELSSSSFIQIREPEENPGLSSSSFIQIREPDQENPGLSDEDEEESDSLTTPTLSAVPQPPPTFVPNHLHMSKSMSLPRPRKLPLSPCPSRPPPISFKINSTRSPESPTMTETSDFSTRVRSMTLPRLGPKSLPPEQPPQNVDHTTKTPLVTTHPDSFSSNSFSILSPATGLKPKSATLKPQQQLSNLAPAPSLKPKSSTLKPQHQPWTCRDIGSPQKKNECFVPSGRFTLTLGKFYTNNRNYFVDFSFNTSSQLLSIFCLCLMQFLMFNKHFANSNVI